MLSKRPILAWVLLLALSLIWGSSFILIKRGLLQLSFFEVGSLRILAASVFMLPIVAIRIRRVKKKHILYLISIGFIGSLIPAFLFAIAQTRLPSGVTGVLNALTPLFTMLVGYLIYKQRQTFRVFYGVLIGFIGTVVLVIASSGGSFTNINFYAFFVILATLMYAFNINIIKYHLQELSSLTITSVSLFIVGPIAAIQLFGFTDFSSRVIADPAVMHAAGFIVLLGVLGTAIALIIFNRLVSLTDPVFTSSVTYIIPIVAVIWGLWDGEMLFLAHYIGIAAILLGVYVANAARKA
ncbi:MAG: drug/metabolite transporter (DMT)-like permease [Marinoscillum sp.]|jgi:drug/metabolite transporter (DMT)-like permease